MEYIFTGLIASDSYIKFICVFSFDSDIIHSMRDKDEDHYKKTAAKFSKVVRNNLLQPSVDFPKQYLPLQCTAHAPIYVTDTGITFNTLNRQSPHYGYILCILDGTVP